VIRATIVFLVVSLVSTVLTAATALVQRDHHCGERT
jgi:hypothetical protein